MILMENPGLYVIITDPVLPFERVAEICVEQEISLLQLRQRGIDDKELLRQARAIKSITRGSKTRFVVNDRADIAVLSDADVLHLGQGDLSVEDARRIVQDMPIGLSTHSLAQAQEAQKYNPLYIGFGPVYATPTKVNPDPVVGVDLLREVVGFSKVPVVAIGGLFPENLDLVRSTGVQSWSLVRYLMESEHLAQRIAQCR